MPYIFIENFAAGLDTTRLPMAARPGTLRMCDNGHITRGGEVSKRRRFAPWLAVPGTKGLATLVDKYYVFGSTPRPPALDAQLGYQQLVAPSGSPLSRVTSWDTFDAKLYVAAEFNDGTVAHFYDGVLVADWYDGRARGSFKIIGGLTSLGGAATGSFQITAAAAGGQVTSVRVGSDTSDNLLSATVNFNTDITTTAADVAANINANTVGAAAVGSFDITAASAGGVVTSVRIGSSGALNLLTANVPFNASIAQTALDVCANINANALSPYTAVAGPAGKMTLTAKAKSAVDNTKAIVAGKTGTAAQMTFANFVAIAGGNAPSAYTAQSDGGKVNLIRKTFDDTDNGKAVLPGKAAGNTAAQMTFANMTNITGGSAPSQITSIKVDNVEALGAPVLWSSSNDATAAAVVAQINSFASVPNYDAVQDGPTVTIVAHDPGSAANGRTAEIVSAGDISVIPANVTLTGGFDAATFVPGKFVKTIQTKMYSPSGPLLHFSGVEEPTRWTTDAIGAGFINMANQDGQSQELLAIERYYSRCAVFARRNVQIWQIDVDPDNNQQMQVLRNTGLIAPGSVEQFGDNDVWYLSDSGVRSLRARDSSTAAAVNDIGTPVDELITAAIHSAGPVMAAEATAVIEPIAGRYWLALGQTIYVYTAFPGAKVAGWSTYSPGYQITDFAILGDQLVFRAADELYQVGGPTGDEVDTTLLGVELPLLDAGKPAHFKKWSAIDIVCEGTWRIYAGAEPLNEQARELVATVSFPTLSMQRIPWEAYGTHANIRLEADGNEPARVATAIVHYELADVG